MLAAISIFLLLMWFLVQKNLLLNDYHIYVRLDTCTNRQYQHQYYSWYQYSSYKTTGTVNRPVQTIFTYRGIVSKTGMC